MERFINIPIAKFLGLPLLSHRGPCQSDSFQNCIVFLHGSGDSGPGIAAGINMSTIPDTVVFYPTAPVQPYALNNNNPSNVWHDRTGLSPDVQEDSGGIHKMGEELHILISRINDEMNIPFDRIVVGGFSMGGHMALHLGLAHMPSFPAGIFVLSSFLASNSELYNKLKHVPQSSSNHFPLLFMAHGTQDTLVPIG